MYLFVFIILLLLLFITALFTELASITFELNTDQNELLFTAFWLSLAVSVQSNEDFSLQLSVFVRKRRVLSKSVLLPRKLRKKHSFIKLHNLILKDAHCEVCYGFSSPFLTGISNGLFPVIQSVVPNVPIIMIPDFFSNHGYLNIKARSGLNVGKTIINSMKKKG